MNDQKRISSIQALRALAFIGIFLQHIGSKHGWSELGVSIFFVMSGALMMYRHFDDEPGTSIYTSLKKAYSRVSVLYPLHILMMCCWLAVTFITWIISGYHSGRKLLILAGETVLNVTLLQSWFPSNEVNASLNGVAWFLSDAVFLYFLFPYIQGWFKKSKRGFGSLTVICLIMYILQILSGMLILNIFGYIEHPTVIWFTYFFPVFRFPEFFIGCCLGYTFKLQNATPPTKIRLLRGPCSKYLLQSSPFMYIHC